MDEYQDMKLLDEKKAAERNAIRKSVEKLSMEVKEKSVALAAAKKRLSELDRESSKTVTIHRNVTTAPFVGVVKPADPTQHRLELRVDSKDGQVKGQASTLRSRLPSSDQKRIDELEQKLQKLLEEVASLKKEKAGERR